MTEWGICRKYMHLGPYRLTSPILASRLETQDLVYIVSCKLNCSLWVLAANNIALGDGEAWSWTCRGKASVGHPGQTHTDRHLHLLQRRKRSVSVNAGSQEEMKISWDQTRHTRMQRHAHTHSHLSSGHVLNFFFNHWASHLLIILQSSVKRRQLVLVQHQRHSSHYANRIGRLREVPQSQHRQWWQWW